MFSVFEEIHESEVIDMVTVVVMGWRCLLEWPWNIGLIEKIYGNRCWVDSVTVREHGANTRYVRDEIIYLHFLLVR